MNTGSQWTAQSAQQLVRYEALFKLLDDIQAEDSILAIAQHVSRQWKYFSNVCCWRLIVCKTTGYQVIDGCRGDACVTNLDRLSGWDEYYWQQQRPLLIDVEKPIVGPEPPAHLIGKAITEIEILPFMRNEYPAALLFVAARHERFSELDKRFIHLFGGYLTDRILGILLREAALESLTHKATYDFLTGLYNRGVVIDRLESQLAHCLRVGQSLSVILADVDHFKNINDNYGHMAGDEVLQEISRRFLEHLRRGEIIGRYGGEEFLFVLYPCDATEVCDAANRFQRIIQETPIKVNKDDTKEIHVTLSFGAASTNGRDDITLKQLLKRADVALYQAKSEGRNTVKIS